jgi:hypothetical protein
MFFFSDRDHVEFLSRSNKFRDQDFEGVPVVIGWEEWPNIGLAHEAEELLPATWDNEAYEFCMGRVDLILMYGSLFTFSI